MKRIRNIALDKLTEVGEHWSKADYIEMGIRRGIEMAIDRLAKQGYSFTTDEFNDGEEIIRELQRDLEEDE